MTFLVGQGNFKALVLRQTIIEYAKSYKDTAINIILSGLRFGCPGLATEGCQW